MEIAKLILEFLSVLIYPTLILTISFLFRKELRELLSGKLTAKYKDLTLTIEKQKKELETAEEKGYEHVTNLLYDYGKLYSKQCSAMAVIDLDDQEENEQAQKKYLNTHAHHKRRCTIL